jgi:hypothetical protein
MVVPRPTERDASAVARRGLGQLAREAAAPRDLASIEEDFPRCGRVPRPCLCLTEREKKLAPCNLVGWA